MSIKYIDELDLKNKKVFIRVDFNVPMDSTGNISDDTRIRASLPTITYALKQNARIILASHLGRPKKPDPKLSLKPVATRLSELLKQEVLFAPDCVGAEVEKMAEGLKPGMVMLLENLRFHPEEEKNDPEFAKSLSRLAEVYINDAFGTAHRAHASTEGIPRLLKEVGGGYLLKKELEYLEGLLGNPARPFVVVLGGAKVSDKLGVITNLINRTDKILIGGGMAYTFLKAQNIEIGKSKIETEMLNNAKSILQQASASRTKIITPLDHTIADKFEEGAGAKNCLDTSIPPDYFGLDIGPKTIKLFEQEINSASTIFWNGPLGVFEWKGFEKGTIAIAQAIAASKGVKVAGGGDTIAAIEKAGVASQFTHISTGGGASLELLEGRKLPGVEILRRN